MVGDLGAGHHPPNFSQALLHPQCLPYECRMLWDEDSAMVVAALTG